MTATVRPARPTDIPDIIRFEQMIALASFGEDAVTDEGILHQRAAKALERDPEGTLVAVDEQGVVVGWLWMSVNTNFVTHEVYANFRSLAVDDLAARYEVGRQLVRAGLDFAAQHKVREVVAKVNATNVGMRVLYREIGFEPTHLSMRMRFDRNQA